MTQKSSWPSSSTGDILYASDALGTIRRACEFFNGRKEQNSPEDFFCLLVDMNSCIGYSPSDGDIGLGIRVPINSDHDRYAHRILVWQAIDDELKKVVGCGMEKESSMRMRASRLQELFEKAEHRFKVEDLAVKTDEMWKAAEFPISMIHLLGKDSSFEESSGLLALRFLREVLPLLQDAVLKVYNNDQPLVATPEEVAEFLKDKKLTFKV